MIAGFENTPARIRDAASEIWDSVLASVDPYKCVKDNLIEKNGILNIAGREYAIRDIKRIFLAGVGKAVGPMAEAVIEILQDRIAGAYLVGKHLDTDFIKSLPGTISAINGSHPIPDMESVESAKGMVEFLKKTYDGDLVINLISGGGSALMTYPHNGISIEDMKKITEMLLESGADIIEINTIRKHLDRVKGGGLAREAYPAQSESLILSDVLGDDVSMIASGPTAVDKTTYQDAVEILKRYGIYKNIPPAIQSHFRKGIAGEVNETLKIGNVIAQKVRNSVIASLDTGINEALNSAQNLGFETEVFSRHLTGEAREIGKQLGILLNNRKKIFNGKPMCIIAGGETTVTLKGDGLGGRNQEIALSAAIEIEGCQNCYFFSLATDGEDGPTDCAGAWVDGKTITQAQESGLDPHCYLEQNNAYHFLEASNSLIKTGPTGTNVNDIVLLFIL